MTPAEVSALLRIKQVRERRAQTALDAARRQEAEAVARKGAAEQARDGFAVAAEQTQREAFERMDAAEALPASQVQATVARLADLRAEGVRLQRTVRQAAAAVQTQQGQTALASAAHGTAMRGAEAFDALKTAVLRTESERAERTEEAETEEPRPARRPGR